jgi:hypothetical protein
MKEAPVLEDQITHESIEIVEWAVSYGNDPYMSCVAGCCCSPITPALNFQKESN